MIGVCLQTKLTVSSQGEPYRRVSLQEETSELCKTMPFPWILFAGSKWHIQHSLLEINGKTMDNVTKSRTYPGFQRRDNLGKWPAKNTV